MLNYKPTMPVFQQRSLYSFVNLNTFCSRIITLRVLQLQATPHFIETLSFYVYLIEKALCSSLAHINPFGLIWPHGVCQPFALALLPAAGLSSARSRRGAHGTDCARKNKKNAEPRGFCTK